MTPASKNLRICAHVTQRGLSEGTETKMKKKEFCGLSSSVTRSIQADITLLGLLHLQRGNFFIYDCSEQKFQFALRLEMVLKIAEL